MQRESASLRRRLGQEYDQRILAAGIDFLLGEALVLKERESFAVVAGNGRYFQFARKLDTQKLLSSGAGAEFDGRACFQRIVRINCCVDVIVDGVDPHAK